MASDSFTVTSLTTNAATGAVLPPARLYIRGWQTDFPALARGPALAKFVFDYEAPIETPIAMIVVSQSGLLPPIVKGVLQKQGVTVSNYYPIKNDGTSLLTTAVEEGVLDFRALFKVIDHMEIVFKNNCSALVMCKAGRNRSVTVALFYYMYSRGVEVEDYNMRTLYDAFLASPLVDLPRTREELHSGRLVQSWLSQLATLLEDDTRHRISFLKLATLRETWTTRVVG